MSDLEPALALRILRGVVHLPVPSCTITVFTGFTAANVGAARKAVAVACILFEIVPIVHANDGDEKGCPRGTTPLWNCAVVPR